MLGKRRARGSSAHSSIIRAIAASGIAVGLIAVTVGLSIATSSPAEAASTAFGPPVEIAAPNPYGGLFDGVTCTGAGDCTAVGYVFGSNGQPIYASESGGTWGTATEVPIPTSLGGFGYFTGVSCTGAADCTAVGYDGNTQPFHVTESGGTWGTPTEVPGSPGGSGYFTGVSCTDAADCTAVGYDGNTQPFHVTESGGTWGTPTEVPGSPGGSGYFFRVSCTGAGDCTAVGRDGNGLPFYATESGGTWGTPAEVPGSPGGSGTFVGVSCTGAGDCTAVGSGNDNTAPIYATESGGTWGTATEVPGAPGGSGGLQSVSCTGAGECTAVGDGFSNSTPAQPIYVTESGSTWGTATEVPGAPGGSGGLQSVSCTDPSDCTAVGGDGNGQPMSASTMGTAAKLGFTTEPGGGANGAAWAIQPVVSVEDSGGNVVATDSSAVTLAIARHPGSGATLHCTNNPATASSGVATFAGCEITGKAGTYTLKATDGSLTSKRSSTFTITVGAAAKLGFTTEPGGGANGAAWAIQPVVSVEDSGGNVVATDSSAVTLAIARHPGSGATLHCTNNPATASSGVATFAGCEITGKAGTYTLKATDGSLTSKRSSTFTITVG